MEGIWYFAYGSNMKSSVMERRGITPLTSQPVVVPSHILCFDIFGIPYAEPSFASIAARGEEKTPPVHGVAYLLTPTDYRQLVLSEGAGVGYNEITLEAKPLNTHEGITVHTLQAKYPWRPNRAPSARYMGLIRDGAREFNLPLSYQDYLDSLPAFVPSASKRFQLGSRLFLFFWRRAVRILARLTKVNTDEQGHCPGWLGGVIVAVYRCMWAWHDHVHSKVWGRGDGR